VNGVNIGLNYGIVGLGANNSTSSFSDVTVQTLMPASTFAYNETFTGGTAQYFDPPTSGTWTYGSGGITGTPPSGGAGVQFMDIGLALGKPAGTFTLQPNATLDLKATLQTAGRAGLVYAYYNSGYYKFAALLADTQQVVLGHYTTKSGFVLDATASWAVTAGTNYTLELTANGNTVSLMVNGSLALSYIYNSVVTSGQFGLISIKGANTFSNAYVRTDDATLSNLTVQHMDAAAAPTGPALGETALTTAELNTLLNAAIDRLSAALALGASSIAELRAATIQIGDLPGLDLGITIGSTITMSRNAAGWGWFIDPTPNDDSEFPRTTSNGLEATPASPANGRMDALTVLMHELEHVLGFPDTTRGLMSEILVAGTRLAPPVDPSSAHVFDEGSGNFLSVNEMSQLRTLREGQINLPKTLSDGPANLSNPLRDGQVNLSNTLRDGQVNLSNTLRDGQVNLTNTLRDGQINPTTLLSDWIVRTPSNQGAALESRNSTLMPAAGLVEIGRSTLFDHDVGNDARAAQLAAAGNVGTHAAKPAAAGKLGGGLISWNKSFIGSSLSRLHSSL
jgi:hypothetical protein